jgi:hypothetical protein
LVEATNGLLALTLAAAAPVSSIIRSRQNIISLPLFFIIILAGVVVV